MKPETLFKAIGDETRLRAVVLLIQHGELCVCELTHALRVSQPKMSRHLAALREAGLVDDRKRGLWVFYRLHPHLPVWALSALKAAADGVAGQPPFARDRRRVRLKVNAPERCRVA